MKLSGKGSGKGKKGKVEIFEPPAGTDRETILEALEHGTLDLDGMLPWSSNYTFLGTVCYHDLKFSVVYKPCRGERPLWDFDHGSLCQREVATYQVSLALGGWPAIPPTVLGDGPHGLGSIQLFIMADYDIHYFTIQDDPRYQRDFQQFSLFDYIVNNADRKGGHCLVDCDDKLWGIDHGLTFHTDYKLRTVIWNHARQKIPHDLYSDLQNFHQNFTPDSAIFQTLETLISPHEIEQFCRRLQRLLQSGRFPEPLGMRDYPYPPV
jgi:uncharacterized repeat protein (TIGR03843 family)